MRRTKLFTEHFLHRIAFTVWHTALHLQSEQFSTKAISCVPQKSAALDGRLWFSKKQEDMKMGVIMEQEIDKELSVQLSYVTERIIALWFPSTLNDIKESIEEEKLWKAASMLMLKHAENCMVFDFSTLSGSSFSEQHRNTFHYLGWQGINLAPPLERLCSACKQIESWLSSNAEHVVVLFARGPFSKERIGVILSAYLTYSEVCGSEELDRFAMQRFFQEEIGCLPSPSSVRYIDHFSGLLSGGIRMNAEPLILKHFTIFGAPYCKTKKVSKGESVYFFLKVYQQGFSLMYSSPIYKVFPGCKELNIVVDNPRIHSTSSPIQLRGDVLIKGYRVCKNLLCPQRYLSNGQSIHRHTLFQCQFHTCSVAKSFLCFSEGELDEGEDNEVKYPPDNGNLQLHFYFHDDIEVKHKFESNTFPAGPSPFSSALYLPYSDEVDAAANILLIYDSMEELSIHKVTDKSIVGSGEIWASGEQKEAIAILKDKQPGTFIVRDSNSFPGAFGLALKVATPPANMTNRISASSNSNVDISNELVRHFLIEPTSRGVKLKGCINEPVFSERVLEHLIGPLDGSLYATISKGPADPPLRPSDSELSRYKALVSVPPSHEQHLDELLGDMLMTVENIPDLCTSDDEDIPYHARKDGMPFTYGTVPERKPREDMHEELSSPGLVRKASKNVAAPELTYPSSDGYCNLTWLQLQQQKLRDRRESKTRQDRHPQEFSLLKELRTYQQWNSTSCGQPSFQAEEKTTEKENGCTSDIPVPLENNFLRYRKNSEEWDGSWKDGSKTGENVPLSISLSDSERTMLSEAASPIITGKSRESACGYGITSTKSTYVKEESAFKTIGLGLFSACDDENNDGERPFVAVKRAHEYAAVGNKSKDNVILMDDRTTPISQSRDDSLSSWATASMNWGEDEDMGDEILKGKARPQTPAFPVHPRTPYSNGNSIPVGYAEQNPVTENQGKASLPPKSPQTFRKERFQEVVCPDMHGTQSLSSVKNAVNHKQLSTSSFTLPRLDHGEHHEVSPAHVKFVRDTSRFWYKPTISREEAIAILKDKQPGTFIVRDSNSFPGAFGLALKVATPPANMTNRISASSNSNVDISNELVRHFLIEPTSRGVKLKGCINEPVFSSLSALVYQHSLTAMALPCQLILPEADPSHNRGVSATDGLPSSNQILLQQGAACNVLYLLSVDTESLTGPQAVRRAISTLFSRNPMPSPTVVHFKVSGQGITLTDSKRKLFFRRHYPVSGISHCSLDPDDHRWTEKGGEFSNIIRSNRCFGFVARKPSTKGDNQCHIFAELDPGQPATAIVNFVTRVMMAGTVDKASNIV